MASEPVGPQRIEGAFDHGGHRLVYESYGEGSQVFVYLHGLLMDSQMNRALAASLAAAGHRVILLDLLGHGRSDKPTRASRYRMDAYGREVVALLDHLGVERAVIGGVSLGAGVGLQTAVQAPERTQALVLEMPVLEWAVPAAALLFTPMLLATHYAEGPMGWLARQVARLPSTGNGALDSVIAMGSAPPDVTTAVLHGILTGPVAPTVEEREAIVAPTLVIAHRRDLIHPFSDAEALAALLPNGQLEPARSMLELRLFPGRLTGRIGSFLDAVWASDAGSAVGADAAAGIG